MVGFLGKATLVFRFERKELVCVWGEGWGRSWGCQGDKNRWEGAGSPSHPLFQELSFIEQYILGTIQGVFTWNNSFNSQNSVGSVLLLSLFYKGGNWGRFTYLKSYDTVGGTTETEVQCGSLKSTLSQPAGPPPFRLWLLFRKELYFTAEIKLEPENHYV